MKVVGVVLDGITVDLIIVDCSIVVVCCAVDIAAKFDCNGGPSICMDRHFYRMAECTCRSRQGFLLWYMHALWAYVHATYNYTDKNTLLY